MRQTSTYGGSSQNKQRQIDDQVLEILGDRAATLSWEQRLGNVEILPGGSNISILSDFKGSIVRLWEDFFSGKTGVQLQTDVKDQLQKRLLLLEHEVDGLLKRRIQFSVRDSYGGERVLDYTGLLNEKENQVVELEKKIQNLEERLRRATLRENQLEGEITRLKGAIMKLEKPNVSRADLETIIRTSSDYRVLQEKYDSLQGRLTGFAGLLKTHSDRLRGQGIAFEFENDLNALIRSEGITTSVINGMINIGETREKVVEVPVSDARTKHLIHMLAVQMKKFVEKYPKLLEECDGRLVEFFQQELIDVIEVDEIDRIVEIVKYVPEVVKVENVYAYSSEKSRKVEFHLRVLIKALLEELEKLRRKTGAVLELDEGVIGMIKAEIMDVVNVDDILKVFRVVPKIVEVEKIVEKVVDRVIEVPQVVPVEKIVEKVIEVVKIQEVEKIVHVPVEILKYVDVHHDKVVTVEKVVEKIVEVPRIIEKIVEKVVEIPKVIHNEVIVEKVVQVEVPTIVERVIHVPVYEIKEVEVFKEKVVTVERVIEVAKPVEVFVEKIVERIVHVPELVTVEKRNDVLVKQIEIRNAREVVNHIQKVPEIVEVIIDRPVPLVQTVERIVEVPKIIEKIVEVRVEVPTVKEVRVVEEKIVYQDRIKEVERIVNVAVELVREVEKVVERRVEVPVIHEKLVKVPEIITQIAIERSENPVIVEVEKLVERIVEVPKIIEVEKPMVVYVNVDNPVKVIVEKIVEVPKTVERIKEVRVNIDKIIEKMVEVPKVVEVEKIVEKVVVVPRVIEKIVEVPQVVEKVVDRLVESTQIVEVEKIVQVPFYQDRIREVEVPINNYITQPEIVERLIEKVVPVERIVTHIETVKEVNDKVIEIKREVPKEILVDKIIPVIHEVTKVVELERPIVVPVEVPIPVDRRIDKVVVLERDVEKLVQVIQEVEKIVEVKCEEIHTKEIIQDRVQVIKEEVIREVERVVPYIQKEYEEVKLYEEKIVLNNVEVERIVSVDRHIEKLVTETHTITNAKEVEKYVDKLIEVPKIVTVENVIPVLVEVNNVVECFRDRPIEIPLLQESIKEVTVTEEKIVGIERKDTDIREVQVSNDRIIEHDKLIVKTDVRNQVETRVQVVDRFEEKIVPITTSVEKIVEVPYVLEKIVEKIVIMPQVVEVLKYVHEIVEQETLGVAVGVDVRVQEAKYQELYGKVKPQFELVLLELRKLRTTNPAFKIQIDLIETFLLELSRLIAFPKIVQVEKEVIKQVDRTVPVLVGKVDAEAERFQVTLSMLVSKLLGELLRIKEQNPTVKFDIDAEVLRMFSAQYREKSGLLDLKGGDFGQNLHRVYGYYDNFLSSIGGAALTHEQQLMYTAALEERLMMSTLIEEANLQIQKAQAISDNRAEAFRIILQNYQDILGRFGDLEKSVLSVGGSSLKGDLAGFRDIIARGLTSFTQLGSVEPVKDLQMIGNGLVYEHSSYLDPHLMKFGGSLNNDVLMRIQGAFRALEKENELLRDKYIRWQVDRPNIHGVEDRDRIIDTLEKRIVQLQSQLNGYRSQSTVSVNVSGNTEAYERQIRTLNSRIQELEIKIKQSSSTQVSSQISSQNQENEIRIRTLNSKIQELESQLRTSKIEYDGKIKSKDKYILELEEKVRTLEDRLKGGDSRATGIGLGSNSYTPSSYSRDGMSASQHSATSSEVSESVSGSRGQYSSYTSGYRQSGVQGPTGLSGSGASYGQANLSGSGASYGQSGYRVIQPATSGATGTTSIITGGTSGSGEGSSLSTSGARISGATYGQTSSSISTGGARVSGATYGEASSISTSGARVSGATYGEAGSSGASYGQGYTRTYGGSTISQGGSTSGSQYTRYQPSKQQ